VKEFGVNILRDLSSQRETINRTKGHLEETDDNVGRARKVLTSMSRRMWANKVILFGIIAFLIFAIILVIYVKIK
jgi:vesicle transport through interaction with t-SNAREs protein 1